MRNLLPVFQGLITTIDDILRAGLEKYPRDGALLDKKKCMNGWVNRVRMDCSESEKTDEQQTDECSMQIAVHQGEKAADIRTNNENSMENDIQDLNDESTRLNKGEKCSGLDQEAKVVSSSIENVVAETHVQKKTEASEIIGPDVLETNVEQEIPSEISQKEKGESAFVQNNSEASETVPAVFMAVEENIQQEISSEISHKEKETELVKERVMGNEIPSSSMSK